jgi:ABC-type lipoprotein release transport system permease subunit
MHARLLTWSLRHRRWRHIINMITVIVTASVVIMFVSVMAMLIAWVRDTGMANGELTRMIVIPKTVGGDAPAALLPQLAALDGVVAAQRYRVVSGRHDSGATYVVVGEEANGLELNTEFFPVAPDVVEAWKKEKALGAVVTEETARDLRLSVGQTVDLPTSVGPLRVKIVGLSYHALVGQRIAIHYEYLQEVTKNPGTCRFRLFAKPADFERVARAVDDLTRNSGSPLQAVSQASFAENQARNAGLVPAILGFLGIFLTIVTALTLANTCAIAIRERRTETATLRVLGFRRASILRVLVSEAVLVGLAGGVCATAVCYALFGKGVELTTAVLPPVAPSPWGVGAGLLVSVVVPLIGALPPALASSRMPLVVALRDTA